MKRIVSIFVLASVVLAGGAASATVVTMPAPPSRRPHVPPGYASYQDYVRYESSVTLAVGCGSGQHAVGTGVAIGPMHVMTAKHVVACGGDGPMLIIGRTYGGRTFELEVEKVGAADAVRLEVIGKKSPFLVHAIVSDRRPDLGETVCMVASTSRTTGLKKCGEVSAHSEGAVIVSMHVVPGNSGAGVFDAQGRVLGLLKAGHWEPDGEFFAAYTPASELGDVLR